MIKSDKIFKKDNGCFLIYNTGFLENMEKLFKQQSQIIMFGKWKKN